jgi:hypothetical protein
MTEAQLIAFIAKLDTAIENILLTGQSYEIGTGSSKRVFTAASLNDLQALRDKKQMQLDNLQTGASVVGF